MMEWKTIDSAPKDGWLILWHEGVFKKPHFGWYNHADNEWELVEFFKVKKDPYIAPTHYMPLPAPPK